MDAAVSDETSLTATEEERGLGVDDFRSRPIVC
jgi:hypothetical protein